MPKEQIDILMHGSPCQDFSRAGEKKGGQKGTGTRSSLLFKTIRIIEEAEKKLQWVIWENVKGVLYRNMRDSFFYYIKEMERLGYDTKYEVLNAMDFGVPQKRERIFAISYYGESPFSFANLKRTPAPKLDEFLEENVMERYGDLFLVKQPSMVRLLEDPNYKREFQGTLKIIKDFCYTISTKQMRVPNAGIIPIGNGKYRYLTEKECWRLMGFSDTDFEKCLEVFPRKKNCFV